MGKYTPLRRYLEGLAERRTTLSFADVERIIGAKLPNSSYRYSVHWSDDWPTRPGSAIREAGWSVDRVDFDLQTITLTR